MRKEEFFLALVGLMCVVAGTTDLIFDEDTARRSDVGVTAPQVVTFKDVEPIFAVNCLGCHSQGDRDWTKYENAKREKDKIRARVWDNRTMPLGRAMSEYERELIRDWVDGGAVK